MRFEKGQLEGMWIIHPERREDERGWFARTYCAAEFGRRGLVTEWVQSSASFNARRGTLRGMHYQRAPHEEVKLIRCTRGRVYDVVVDLRRESRTWRKWQAVELSEENGVEVYVPKGCAHGFVTMESETELSYQMSQAYAADRASGVRWDDPALAIEWPDVGPLIVSEKDQQWARIER